MQQAVEVAQVRNDEMAAATKTAECQNGLPGESGGKASCPPSAKEVHGTGLTSQPVEHRRCRPGASLLSERRGL